MIHKYEVISPVTNRKNPYLDDKDFLIVPDIRTLYDYYVEVKRYNAKDLCYEYFILLSTKKFDSQCRKCRVDDYNRLKAKLHGEIKDYVRNEMNARGNVNFRYIESEESYDVWKIE